MRPLLENGRRRRARHVGADGLDGRPDDQAQLRAELDPSGIPNVKNNLIDRAQGPGFDPNREFSAPWQSGMTGLIYRKDKVAKPESINAIFDPKLRAR